jgi:hypothetical protein
LQAAAVLAVVVMGIWMNKERNCVSVQASGA